MRQWPFAVNMLHFLLVPTEVLGVGGQSPLELPDVSSSAQCIEATSSQDGYLHIIQGFSDVPKPLFPPLPYFPNKQNPDLFSLWALGS